MFNLGVNPFSFTYSLSFKGDSNALCTNDCGTDRGTCDATTCICGKDFTGLGCEFGSPVMKEEDVKTFNTEKGIEYLKEYLEYYLTRKDVHFDQRIAMSTLNWTDKKNGTNEMNSFLPKYQDWVSDKYSQDINQSIANFEKQIEQLNQIKVSS